MDIYERPCYWPERSQMYFISQYGEHDCLFTCMAMMLANYHHDRNYLFLPHEDRQFSYYDILKEAEKYHTTLLGVNIANVNELSKSRSFPIIVTIMKNRFRHSVLLYRVNKKFVYYYDPACGKKKESLSTFASKWTKRAIIVDMFDKTPCPVIPPRYVAKRDRITLPIFQLLSGISLLAATYFIDKDFPIYLSILLFSSFVIFELLFRQNLINAMRRMDENLYSYKVKCPQHLYFGLYKDIEEYRYLALSIYPNVIYSSLIICFMIFVMIINSKFNVIYILLSVLLAAIEVVYYQPYYKNKSEEIAEEERHVKNAQNEYEFNYYCKEAREKSYKIGIFKSIFSYVGIAVLLVAIIIVMALTSTVNVTYVVFYLCISLFLKGEFSKIFIYSTTSDDFDSKKNKVIQRLK